MGRKKKSRKRPKQKISLAVIGGAIGGLADPIQSALGGDYQLALRQLAYRYTGYDIQTKQWNLEGLKMGVLPLVVGAAISKGASMLGLNRYFKKLPFKI